MGIMPIGPFAMLPLERPAGSGSEPTIMARVERSARAEEETYSPSGGDGAHGDGEPQPGRHGSGDDGQDSEPWEDGQGLDGEAEDDETGLARSSVGAAPSFELAPISSAKISFFA
jgi:hypothetical protein